MPQVQSSRTTSLAVLEQFTADLSWYFSIILLGGDVRFENVRISSNSPGLAYSPGYCIYGAPGRPQRPETIGSDARGQLLVGKAQATKETRNGTEHKSRIMSQNSCRPLLK